MQSLLVLFQLCGAVALLLFGIRLVREGVTEALGVRLKVALGLGTRTGPRAFLAGLVATLGLQSSTATALMTAGFVEREMIRPRRAQVVLLGANVGTALTAWIVASGMTALAPALVFAGYVLRRAGPASRRGAGLAVIGVGLMLLSIELLEQASAPLRGSAALAAFLQLLDGAWLVGLAVAAALAVLCSSSLAVVMLLLSLDGDGGISAALTVVMVLGANLGGAIPPVLASAQSSAPARRLVLGNLVTRAAGCLLALPFVGLAARGLATLPGAGDGLAVEAHLAFNLVLAAIAWPCAGLVTRAIEARLSDPAPPAEEGPRWLDEAALATPALALTGASREALAVGDLVERMMAQCMAAFRHDDMAALAEIPGLEARVDRLQQEVKIYLSRLGNQSNDADRAHAIVILDYVINLEHIGDIIDKGLQRQVRKKIDKGLRFSDEGYHELSAMFLLTAENLRVAQTIFLSRDRALARELMEVKVGIRRMERDSAERHFLRLRDGRAEALQTSSLHLDMLRDLKRINAHIVSVAHPILDQDGLLAESRLKSAS